MFLGPDFGVATISSFKPSVVQAISMGVIRSTPIETTEMHQTTAGYTHIRRRGAYSEAKLCSQHSSQSPSSTTEVFFNIAVSVEHLLQPFPLSPVLDIHPSNLLGIHFHYLRVRGLLAPFCFHA